MDPSLTETRIDLWLWAARFFKTRSLAKAAIERHQVRVSGQVVKSSRTLRIGDSLRIERGDEVFEIEVRAISDRRGGASVARMLYVESEASIAARMAERERRRFEALGYRAPEGKPDKKARRLLRALGDLDML